MAGPLDDETGLLARSRPGDNAEPLSVSDLSAALKRTVEDRFGFVRLRGELSGVKRAASGHLYATLKDERACIDAVMWRSSVPRLSFAPEDGLDVVASGKLTTYPGRSKYQIVIERMELAGEGALLALLEKTRARLAGEGLFDATRKRALPFIPAHHRRRHLAHRRGDPRHPAPAGRSFPEPRARLARAGAGAGCGPPAGRGDRAGFGRIAEGGAVARPDLIIVARGGGSTEDLWSFNEEAVVRAIAASPIPVISAVGHETDTSLADHAADHRAPTPTAAAERAVPVLAELAATLADLAHRKRGCALRPVALGRERLAARVDRLPRPERLLEARAQRLDELAERLRRSAGERLRDGAERLRAARISVPQLRGQVERAGARLEHGRERLQRGGAEALRTRRTALGEARLSAPLLAARGERARLRLTAVRLDPALLTRPIAERRRRIDAIARLTQQLHPDRPLTRGYVRVTDAGGNTIVSRKAAAGEARLALRFADGTLDVAPFGGPTKRAPRAAGNTSGTQEDLFG